MEKRLSKISKALGGNEPPPEQILFVNVCAWPLEDQERFRVGTPEAQEDLIEAHCGRRPVAAGPHGAIRTIIDLPIPPMDPTAAVAEADRIARQGTN